jgi:hypothetical protein
MNSILYLTLGIREGYAQKPRPGPFFGKIVSILLPPRLSVNKKAVIGGPSDYRGTVHSTTTFTHEGLEGVNHEETVHCVLRFIPGYRIL